MIPENTQNLTAFQVVGHVRKNQLSGIWKISRFLKKSPRKDYEE